MLGRKIKICLAIPSLQAGGMERVMSEIAWNYSRRGEVELHLVMFGRDREIFYPIPQNMQIHKPSFVYTPKHRTMFTLRTILYIRKELMRIKPDTVLSLGNYWNSLVLLSTLGTHIPVFVSDRSNPNKDMGKLQNWLRIKLYPKAAGVIAQTQKAREVYQRMYGHKNMTIIGNPIRDVKSDSLVKREKMILSIGRLINTKHYDRLINIFAAIDNPEWKLCIVGGDALKLNNSEKYRKQIEKMHLQGRVILTGMQKNVDDYLNKASIFAFPSSSEGFPNVIGEAMVAGLPVVSYDCVAGPSDMIEDGKNGYLVPVFDDELMKERLRELMQDEQKRIAMGDNAKESIRRFDKDVICQHFYEFITKGVKQ